MLISIRPYTRPPLRGAGIPPVAGAGAPEVLREGMDANERAVELGTTRAREKMPGSDRERGASPPSATPNLDTHVSFIPRE